MNPNPKPAGVPTTQLAACMLPTCTYIAVGVTMMQDASYLVTAWNTGLAGHSCDSTAVGTHNGELLVCHMGPLMVVHWSD
jgi:hypothetical protein